ncbi:hypothetical protein LXL04_032589 [Taraxacum kok-saghyz]
MIWNVRGLCNSSTQKEVASMLNRNRVSMCALLETRMHVSWINKVCKKIKESWHWYSNANMCRRGTRIAIGWDPGAWDVFVIHSYDQVVHCKVFSKSSNHTFFMSFVYAENDYRERRKLWEYLRAHQPLVQNEPWLITDDFNQIRKPSESTRSSSFDSYMGDFERCVEDKNLVDINATGLYYTWNQKPRGIRGLLRKLDRTMGNANILSLFPRISVMYKPYGISDHSPAIIEFPNGKPKKSYDFKFVNNTTNHTDFLSTVNATWNNRIEGHSMYSLFQKLKQLKTPIRKLAQQMGNPAKKVNALRIEVEKAQEELDCDPDNEEITKLNWLKKGDRNTKYYHKVIKEIQSRNRINSVTDGEGMVHGADKVADIAIDHFSDFLGKARDVAPITSPADLFTNRLSKDDADWMIRPIEDDEIKQAIFDIGNDKAPGPDGYTSVFFKKAWHIVGTEVCIVTPHNFSHF